MLEPLNVKLAWPVGLVPTTASEPEHAAGLFDGSTICNEKLLLPVGLKVIDEAHPVMALPAT